MRAVLLTLFVSLYLLANAVALWHIATGPGERCTTVNRPADCPPPGWAERVLDAFIP